MNVTGIYYCNKNHLLNLIEEIGLYSENPQE